MWLKGIETTADVEIPSDLVERVIGQDAAVEKSRLALKQKRHLLLVGPPGVGKSMLAQALAQHLPKPRQQISVIDNSSNQNRPLVAIQELGDVERDKRDFARFHGTLLNPKAVPAYVAERLGFRCANCGFLDGEASDICPRCGSNKSAVISASKKDSPFGGIMTEVLEVYEGGVDSEVQAVRIGKNGSREAVLYRREGRMIRALDRKTVMELKGKKAREKRNVIVPLERKTFVHATGASETELLGDVRHDPYGGHPEIGTPPYLRVIPGAVHEAHEGVLFIDELPHLGPLQSYILTAMQEKKFPITGRNPQSSGASVKVDNVPCDFLFIGACNIGEVGNILSPLRSRLMGGGYEILLETTMPDTDENRMKLVRFIAQEITADGRIPHATSQTIEALVEEAKRRAYVVDHKKDALTLRLRDLGGVVRMAGDFAVLEGSDFIEPRHVKRSRTESKSIERQLEDRYGSVWRGIEQDNSVLRNNREDRSYL